MDFKYNIDIALCMSVTSTKQSKILIHGYENFNKDEPMTLKDLKNNLTNSMISHFFVIYSYFRSMCLFVCLFLVNTEKVILRFLLFSLLFVLFLKNIFQMMFVNFSCIYK